MARRTIFNATFCCGNMLQQFEVDSNCCNIVARTLSELVRVTPSTSTFNATLYQNALRESRNKSRDQSTSAFFHVNKNNCGDCWQWSRASRHMCTRSKEKPKIVEESSERTKRNHFKRPRGALWFQLHIRRASRSMEKSEGMYAERGQENWKRYCIISVDLTRRPPYCWR